MTVLTELPPGPGQVLRYRHPGEQGPGDEAVLGGREGGGDQRDH